MSQVLGFDVYGTLIDTHGVITLLETMIGDAAPRFSQQWREKQLEYTFRRGLMQQYRHFGICTRDALDHTSDALGHTLTDDQKQQLLAAWNELPAFPDAVRGLEILKGSGHQLHAFSNGQAAAVDKVLENAGIRHYFMHTVSVDSIETFKPDQAVYRHFLESTNSTTENAWLVSSNGFDVIGAAAIGMNTVWIQRNNAVVFDPWEYRPTITLDSLESVADILRN